MGAPRYDQGGLLNPGDPEATPPCRVWHEDYPNEFNRNDRCKGFHMAVADYDGNGGDDLAVIVPKGMNDILFNNIGGERCGDAPWCPRVGLLSARSDLRIASVLATTTNRGFGENNLAARALNVASSGVPSGADIVVINSGLSAETASGHRFKNQIESPFPHGIFCDENDNCPEEGQRCLGLLAGSDLASYFSDTKVCFPEDNFQQSVVHGWFKASTNTLPGRTGNGNNSGLTELLAARHKAI